ncbi:DUF981 family protein [Actinoplanes sp. NPDC051859]|uniref:DUF981 family protein n=1 Tax=Actinoplanes sp. NPDC051859 TaxID=3363909 RepID=UPI003794E4F0
MFNTLMGVCAGLALLLVPRYWASVRGDRLPLQIVHGGDQHGWAATFGLLGTVLTGLGGVMTITHPLAPAKPYIDTIFGEPTLLLGVLLLAAAWRLAHRDDPLDERRLHALLAPASVVVFALGVVLVWCCLAILRFDVISAAPAAEPLTGLMHDHPAIENTFFAAVLYGPAAIGCLLTPFALDPRRRRTWLTLYWCWTIAGLGFTAFSAVNFYTHTGMLVNAVHGNTVYRW